MTPYPAGPHYSSGESKALILMYHRVADVHADPFSLSVTPGRFAGHMEILSKYTRPLRLRELNRALCNRTIPPRSVVLTFDDGYADNLQAAKPLLERYDIPATVFVTTGFIGSGRELWWDELERVFLEPGALPETLSLEILGNTFEWGLGGSGAYGDDDCRRYRGWTVEKEAPTPRHRAYASIWRLIQLLPDSERRQVLDRIVEWAGMDAHNRAGYGGLSAEQVQALALGGLVEIGAHTVTHPALPALSADGQRNEVGASRARLEEILGASVTSFAYPYGALTTESAAIVRDAGFDCACATVSGFVEHDSDRFELPRVQVCDWGAEEFGRRLETWFSSPCDAKVWAVASDNGLPEQVLIRGKWDLRTADGNTARLVFPPGDAEAVRIEIGSIATQRSFDVQLNQPHLAVEANQEYEVCFQARADAARSLSVGFAQAHEPWNGLGLYAAIELSAEWQSFRLPFIAAAGEDNGRIHFDAGANAVSVELSGLALRVVTEAPRVPDVMPHRAEGPMVSVVTIFLNAERFIQEAIQSAILQTYSRWELLLVDDGSSDRSTEIALSYAEQYPGRIIYLEHEHHCNRGMSASRNLGIRHCRGKYVAFLDADDVWLPHKLERQVATMESQPRAAMIYGASRYWHSWSGNPDDPGRDFVPDPGVPTKGLLEPPVLIKQLYPFGPATTPRPSNFLVRRDALEDIGGFEEHFRGVYQLYDDQAFLVKLYLHGAIFVSSEEWDKYRIHPGSCDAAAVRGGHYDSIRGFFLKWFETYLRRQDISNPEIWSLLRSSVAAARVQLRTDGGSTARLAGSLDDPEGVQIAIEKAATGAAPDIQLNLPYYELQAGRRYALHFRGRADRPRNLGVGVAAAHAPWTGLGLYRQIELTAEWRRFEVEFAAAADEDNARIYFDAGESDPSVELTAVSLRQMPEGQPIEPSLALVQTS